VQFFASQFRKLQHMCFRSLTLDDLELFNFLGMSRDFADLGGNNG